MNLENCAKNEEKNFSENDVDFYSAHKFYYENLLMSVQNT